jgi:hypothetical protein
MVKKMFYYLVALCLVGTVTLFAGTKDAAKKQLAIDSDKPSSVIFNTGKSYSSAAAVTFTVVDTSANSYGFATVNTNNIAFDPYSNSVVIVHRGKSTYGTSGGIFYAYSTNGGTSWTKRMGPLQGGTQANTNGRYPTIALSNPTKAKSKDSVLVIGVWPMLVGGAFGGMLYSVDPGVGANQPIPSALDTTNVWGSSFTVCASTNSSHVLFAGQPLDKVILYRSTDGLTFTGSTPAQLTADKFYSSDDVFSIAYRNNNFYMGLDGYFGTDSVHRTVAVTKSTDKGSTWSTLEVVPWWTISGLQDYYILRNNYTLGNVKMTVDNDNGIHVICTMVDTVTVKPAPGKWMMYDLYKASGATAWTATKIADLPKHYNWHFDVLDQTTIETQVSASEDGKMIAAKWIQDLQGDTYADSAAIADVFTSMWNTTSKVWATPKNLTGTPTSSDMLSHIATAMANDGTVHFFVVREAGKDRIITDANPAVMYYANAKVTAVRDRVEPIVGTYALDQNYPNPFNPSTTISFTLPVRDQVTLKVYNMIGQEVATLINGENQAGTYFVDFDASRLASGVYFYTLQTSNFTSSKKMTLVK